MWTQRTGGGLWNCRLSRKNKRPAVGAHRWAGGKRQLEGSPIYKSERKVELRTSKRTPVCPSQLVWPFDPNTVPPSFRIMIFHTCIKVIIKGCASVCFPCFLSSHVTKISTTITSALVPRSESCALLERFFFFFFGDLRLDTTSWTFLFFFF